jgi:hypothetical protein
LSIGLAEPWVQSPLAHMLLLLLCFATLVMLVVCCAPSFSVL